MDSSWPQGLVLVVDARKQNLKESICFKLTNECWKTFLKIMAKVDTLLSLALSSKRQNVTLKHVGPKEHLIHLTSVQIFS